MRGDLVRKSPVFSPLNSFHGSSKRTMDAAYQIVQLWGGRIQAQDQALHARMLQFGNGIRGQQRSGWKGQKRMQVSDSCILHQLINIFTLQRIRAGDYEDGRAK